MPDTIKQASLRDREARQCNLRLPASVVSELRSLAHARGASINKTAAEALRLGMLHLRRDPDAASTFTGE